MRHFLTLAAVTLALGVVGLPAQAASTGQAVTVVAADLFPATSGISYRAVLEATGGTGPYAFSLVGGTLPNGLALSSDGMVSGVPDDVPGMFAFTVQALDATGAAATNAFTLQLATPMILLTSVAIPAAHVGQPYGFAFFATGGSPRYTYSLATGSLPAGLELTSNGVVSGTPKATGVSLFTLQIVDAHGVRGTQTFRLVVDKARRNVLKNRRPTAWAAALAHTGSFGGVAFLP